MKLELSPREMGLVLRELIQRTPDFEKGSDWRQVLAEINNNLLKADHGHTFYLAHNPDRIGKVEELIRQLFFETTGFDSYNFPFEIWPVEDLRRARQGEFVVLTAELPEGRKKIQLVEKGAHMDIIRRRAGLVVMHSETPVHNFQVGNISREEALEAGAIQPLAFIKFG